jgi:hypothetical protein
MWVEIGNDLGRAGMLKRFNQMEGAALKSSPRGVCIESFDFADPRLIFEEGRNE